MWHSHGGRGPRHDGSNEGGGGAGGSIKVMMAGLEAFDDPGRLLMCLHELNHLLLRGAEGLNLGRILGAVTQILSRMQGNSQIAVLACRALNNLIDLEPGITSNIAGDGVALPVLCQKLVHLTDMDVAEQCIKWYSSTSKHTTTTIHHHQSLSPTPCLCNVCVCNSLRCVGLDYPSAVLQAGGLTGVMAHFSFLPEPVQVWNAR